MFCIISIFFFHYLKKISIFFNILNPHTHKSICALEKTTISYYFLWSSGPIKYMQNQGNKTNIIVLGHIMDSVKKTMPWSMVKYQAIAEMEPTCAEAQWGSIIY